MIEVSLERTTRRPPAWFLLPALLLGLWLGLVAALHLWGPPERPVCMFRNLTGVPCPTCGSTRAVQAAADGRLLEALRLNPLLVASAAAGAVWAVMRVGFGRRVRVGGVVTGRRGRVVLWTGLGLLVAANWIWVIARETIDAS